MTIYDFYEHICNVGPLIKSRLSILFLIVIVLVDDQHFVLNNSVCCKFEVMILFGGMRDKFFWFSNFLGVS